MAPNDTSKTPAQIAAEQEQARHDERIAAEGVEGDLQPGVDRQEPTQREVPREEPQHVKVQKSPADTARDAIAARFKRGDSVPFDGDMNSPELLGDAGRVALEPDEGDELLGDAAVLEPDAPVVAPVKKKLTIRGQVVEMTDDEILAAAQKTLAADSYLDEAKELLKTAKEIKTERAGRDHQHPDGQHSTQDDGQELDADGNPRHPGDEVEALVEQIQFGDPKEAAKGLRQLIKKQAEASANEGQIERLYNNDLAKSQKVLAAFTVANPEIANSEDAAMLLSSRIHKIYRDDIVKLGAVDPSKIPTNNKDLANWHRWYRVHGADMTPMEQVFEKAKAEVVKVLKIGGEAPQPRKGEPRVEVNVDRTARRAAIPNQPTRAVAPRRDAVTVQGRTPAAEVIANMRKARGQIG